jgi:hypothetical protein
LQKIAAIATFRRFRRQPVKLAYGSSGSSGYAGKPRAYCPAVTPLALAAAYITPHYAPLPAVSPRKIHLEFGLCRTLLYTLGFSWQEASDIDSASNTVQ